MRVFVLLNDLHSDGMGSVAVSLMRAMRGNDIRVVPLHAYDEIDLPGYREEFRPQFVAGIREFSLERDAICRMVEALNGLTEEGDVCINNGSSNWLACLPYLKSGVKWVTGVHSINPSTLKICRAYADRVSAFVCISEGVRQRFLRKLPRRFHRKVHLICNAVDDCPFPKTDYRLVDRAWSDTPQLRILYVGRIEDTSKGCGKLPKILVDLKRRGVPAKLDLYGYFHNWEREWWSEVDKAGVREMVDYRGQFDHAKIYELLVKYDVFISSSNFEGFGLSLAEAMNAGLPCVSSLIPQVTDWLLDAGRCGALVAKSDIRGYAEALTRIYNDVAHRRAIGTAARARIGELASFAAYGMRYANLFRACSSDTDYKLVPSVPLDRFKLPECLKPWGPARLLPTRLKTCLRKFMH